MHHCQWVAIQIMSSNRLFFVAHYLGLPPNHNHEAHAGDLLNKLLHYYTIPNQFVQSVLLIHLSIQRFISTMEQQLSQLTPEQRQAVLMQAQQEGTIIGPIEFCL